MLFFYGLDIQNWNNAPLCTINIDSVLINNKMRCPLRNPENKSSITVFYSRPIYAKIPLLCLQTDKLKNCLRMIYITLLCLRPTTYTTGDGAPYLWCSINEISFPKVMMSQITLITCVYILCQAILSVTICNHLFPARVSSEILCLSMASSCCGTAKHPYSTSSRLQTPLG